MTRQSGRYRRIGLPCLLLAYGCAGHPIEAVQATGAAGQELSWSNRTLGGIPALCLEIASLSGANDDCAALRDEARAWGRVVALLAAYGRGLSHLGGDHDVTVAAGITGGGWTGLKPDEVVAARALASVTRGLHALGHDTAALRKVIGGADEPLQKLARAIDTMVERQVAAIDLAETSVDVLRQRLQQSVAFSPSPPRVQAPASPAPTAAKRQDKEAAARAADVELIRPTISAIGAQLTSLQDAMTRQAGASQAAVPGSLAGLAAVQNDLESKRERFEQLRDAVDVFAQAHKTLHDNVDQIDTEALLVKVLAVTVESAKFPPIPN